jgi:cytochrome b561/polyisoprenoid-binding protein YceI
MNNAAADRQEHYNHIAMLLHWLIAVFIIGLIPVGLVMENTPKSIQITVFQLHKSFGLMVLFLSLARLGWRFLNPPPPLLSTLKPWERGAAHSLHFLFYFLIIAIPLSGWALVSASPKNIPTMFLTLFHWPHLWFLAQMEVTQKKAIIDNLQGLHATFALGTAFLLLLHIGAALKHHFVDKDVTLARMVPALGQTEAPLGKPRGLWAVFASVTVLFLGIAALGNLPEKTGTAPTTGPPATLQGNWVIHPQTSALTFTFTHVGRVVKGKFSRWEADIQFDPKELAASHIIARIDLGSASTGDATYDTTLPQADWFDVANHGIAVFESSNIRALGNGAYSMAGSLKLRGISLPLSLPFTLTIKGNQAHVEAQTSLDRLSYGLGANADAAAEYVARSVAINLVLDAQQRSAP